MTLMTRRNLLRSSASLGALLTLPAVGASAQQFSSFTPLGLNSGGRRWVDPTASSVTQVETQFLQDYLGGNPGAALNDLQQIDRSITSLQQQPGPFVNDPRAFNAQADLIHRDFAGARRERRLGFGTAQRCVKDIDIFISQWYPCNAILGIGGCQRSIWTSFGAGFAPPPLYFNHLNFELDSFFRFHNGVGVGFGGQSIQLVRRCRGLERIAVTQPIHIARREFSLFSRVTNIFFRTHYPRWC